MTTNHVQQGQSVRNPAEKKKIGHRRVTEEGTITYKKKPTSELQQAVKMGIYNSVGGLAGKPLRDLLQEDFGICEIQTFPREGSSVTPAHNMSEFKFRTYAPAAFRHFRNLFQIDISQFLMSLCEDELKELSNPGASGSIFYISQDDEFIIKTVQHKEAKYLQKLLTQYFITLNQNPRTLLPKYYGLYCYQCGNKNIRFVIMNNLLPSNIELHEKYDLKGSTYKRRASAKERGKKNPTLKDLDFKELHEHGIYLEPAHHERLMKTIERDCRVLESFRIMDYSLLLGIHNSDVARRSAAICQEEVDCRSRAVSGMSHIPAECNSPSEFGMGNCSSSQEDLHVSVAVAAVDGDNVGGGGLSRKRPTSRNKRIAAFTTAMEAIHANRGFSSKQKNENDADGTQFLSAEDGIPARNERNERLYLFIGIIDILQSYRMVKKLEHGFKSIVTDGDTVSVHNPHFYSQRFQRFLREEVFTRVDGGGGGPGKSARRRLRNGSTIIQSAENHSAAISTTSVAISSSNNAANISVVITAASSVSLADGLADYKKSVGVEAEDEASEDDGRFMTMAVVDNQQTHL